MAIDLNELTDEELEQVALGNRDILSKYENKSSLNMQDLSDDQLQMVANGTPLSEIKNERNEYVGMGTSIAGALTGAAIGSAVPVVGTVIGGLVGGALGAFGGELIEDSLVGEDLDFANAAKEGAISVGIDVATLGAMKWAKPAYYSGKRLLGFTPNEVAKDIAEKAALTASTQQAGTQYSLASTSQILAEKGAVLTPSQIPTATGIDKFYENIGRGGILSGRAFDDNMVKINDAVSGAVNELIVRKLGAGVNNIFGEAKKSLSRQYELGLDSVMGKLKNDMLDVSPIHKALDSVIKSSSNKLGGTSLQKETISLLSGLKKDLSAGMPKRVDIMGDVQVRTGTDSLTNTARYKTTQGVIGTRDVPQPIPAVHLIEWQKKVNKIITEMGNPQSPMYNGVIDAELAQAAKVLNGSIGSVMTKTNKSAFDEYLLVKKEYSKGIRAIKPASIKSLINSASKEDYEGLGKVLLPSGTTNFSKFTQTFNAVKFSVNSLKPQQLRDLGFKSKDDVFNTIKASYVKDLFPDVSSTAFDVSGYAKQLTKLSAEQVKQAKVVLGKDYGRFNQIRNAIIDSAEKPKTDVGLLSLRSRELGLGAAVAAGSTGGISGGLAALFAPKIMAKISLSPKKSARLINLMGRQSNTPEGLSKTQQSIALLVAEALDTAVD